MEQNFNVPTVAELAAKGETPEILFWVGCAGSFDDRAKKITKAIAKILHKAVWLSSEIPLHSASRSLVRAPQPSVPPDQTQI